MAFVSGHFCSCCSDLFNERFFVFFHSSSAEKVFMVADIRDMFSSTLFFKVSAFLWVAIFSWLLHVLH